VALMHGGLCMAIHCTVTVRTNANLLEHQLRQVKSYHEKPVPHIMTAFLYRCPNTDQQVQAWTDNPPVADDPEAYQSVKCIACSRLHWVNPRTGRVLEPRQA
jgi:hypothetical protein